MFFSQRHTRGGRRHPSDSTDDRRRHHNDLVRHNSDHSKTVNSLPSALHERTNARTHTRTHAHARTHTHTHTHTHTLFASGYSQHLGSPDWFGISFFHFVVSSTSSSHFHTSLSTWFSVFISVSFLVLVHLTFFLALPH